ncbi:hypothetical protein AB4Z21_04470 [Paenibacillus sp. MCAF20]
MRIQMRLSHEAEVILRMEKQKMEKAEGVSPTYGYIINQKVREVFPIKKSVNWEKVKDAKVPYEYQSSEKGEIDYSTTLNLELSVLKCIEELQVDFKDIFHVARVHKSFVVRLVLKAAKLLEMKEDISKQQ